MKVKDILPSYPVRTIEVRTNTPDDVLDEDMLFGFCHWTGTELVSEDGDDYYLDEEIYKWEYDEFYNALTYWIVSEWN
jgi:hypothetical protein